MSVSFWDELCRTPLFTQALLDTNHCNFDNIGSASLHGVIHGSTLTLQIHDELDLEVPHDEIETVSRLVKETMEEVVELKGPLIADVSYGPNWAEAK